MSRSHLPPLGVLPYDWESRQPWLDLPFPLAGYEGRLARLRDAMAVRGLGQATVEDNILARDGSREVLSAAAGRLW